MLIPYRDQYLTWDDFEERYFLTEEALKTNGMDIRARASRNKANAPEYVINGFVRVVSNHIYNFIHEHSANNCYQDKIISTIPSMRKIIYKALITQAIFVYKNGDWTLSPNEWERANYISPQARADLNTTITELGRSILYIGV